MTRRESARPIASVCLGAVAFVAACLSAAPARAAALAGPISGWQKGSEPSWVSMYEYVPSNLAANAPILVLVHYCGGNAAGVMGEAQGGGLVAAADKYGFLIVVPQTSQNCWDIATKPSLTHDGGGDTGAIVDQVKYAITKHNANANRVYVTGTSSGAMMTQGLLAVYPDVFKAGAEFAGVPAGCWAVNDPAGQWSGPCAGGQVTHTAADWGTMVKGMYPGYSGFRPRVQLWHGEADSIISFTNQTEAIKQWTNVLGVSTSPTSSTTVTISNHQYTRQQWQDSCGSSVLDAWTETNGPHGTDANLNAEFVVPFLALDKAGDTDPQVARCMAAGGGTGTGGGSSSAGSSSTGGSGGSSSVAGAGNGGNESSGGNGGSSGSSQAPSAGTNASTAGSTVGTSGGSAGGGSLDGDTTSDAPGAAVPSRPGCACDLVRSAGAGDTCAWAGVLALGSIFGRRRRANRS